MFLNILFSITSSKLRLLTATSVLNSTSFVIGLIYCFLTGTLCPAFISMVMMLSMGVIGSILCLHKQAFYFEEYCLCKNDFNMLLVLMSVTLFLLVTISTWSSAFRNYNLLNTLLLLMVSLCFLSSDLLLFYLTFESSLLPILILILAWGYQPERLQAGLFMILYTVAGSMPLLLMVVYLINLHSTNNFYTFCQLITASDLRGGLMLIGLSAFLVKLPIFSIHVWLPKAHVEAPVGGSMILAGILLKLGGYGMYQWSNMFTFPLGGMFSALIISLSLWGGFLACLICLSQDDIKSMIAYSSIVHMSLVVVGLMSGSSWGSVSALITLLAHGWASSALFMLSYVTYLRIGSRSFSLTKGLLEVFPYLSLLWFIMCTINMAAPPTINFMGELFLIPAAWMMGSFILIVSLLIMFAGVCYNMYLYSLINHGSLGFTIISSKKGMSHFFLAFFGHIFPLLFLLKLSIFACYTVICM